MAALAVAVVAADALAFDPAPSPQLKLLLLDEIAEAEMLITRYFPNASIITASRHPVPADAVFYLQP